MPIYTSLSNQVYIGYPILKEREETENVHELDRYYTTIVVAKNMQGTVLIVNKYDDLKQRIVMTAAEWDWLGHNREEINQLWTHNNPEEGKNGLYYESGGDKKTLYIKLTTYQVKHGSKKVTKLNISRFYKKKSGLAFMSQYHIRMSKFEWDQLMQDYDEINEYFLSDHSREVQEWSNQQALSYETEENPTHQSSSRAVRPLTWSPSSTIEPLQYVDEMQLSQQRRRSQQKQNLPTEPTSALRLRQASYFYLLGQTKNKQKKLIIFVITNELYQQ